MSNPRITLTGHLGGDPKLRFTPNGSAVADLRVASTPRRKVGEEWVDGETLWFDVSVWNSAAENIAASLHKGDKVTVAGELAQSTYTKDDGTSAVKLAVKAAVVGADLSRCKVTISRIVRQNAAEDAFGAEYNGEPEPIAVDEETGEIIAA